jgi:DNA-binding CsgD family transcriptional regulator
VDVDLLENNIIKLNHEIEFYWNQEPFNQLNDFDTSVLRNPVLIKLPRVHWGKIENTTPKGFGTFQYRLQLPDTIHSYSLYAPRFTGGCEIWVNNSFQISHGVYSKDLEKSTSYGKPVLIKLPKQSEIIVTILTSNSDDFLGGGINFFMAIGKQSVIHNYINKELIKDYIVFLLLLLLTLYLLYLYYLYKEARYLYLMLTCLVGCVRSICIQQHIIYEISPIDVPFYVLQKLRLMTVYMGTILSLLYFRELLPKRINKRWFQFLLYSQIIGLSLYFLVSTYFATKIAVVMRLLFLVVMIYCVYLVVISYIKKEKYAKEILLTTVFILVIVVNGVFKTGIVINTLYIGISALFCYLLAHMYINAKIQKDKTKKLIAVSLELEHKQKENINLKLETLTRIRNNQKIKTSLKKLSNKTDEVKTIIAEIQKNNGEDQKSEKLKSEILHDFQEFPFKLSKLHPVITKTDVEIACFIVLGKSRQEIADLRNVAVSSIKTSRTRLRKKLGLSKDILLDEYLKSLL